MMLEVTAVQELEKAQKRVNNTLKKQKQRESSEEKLKGEKKVRKSLLN